MMYVYRYYRHRKKAPVVLRPVDQLACMGHEVEHPDSRLINRTSV